MALTLSWEMHCPPESVGSACTAPRSCPSPAGWRTGAAAPGQRWLWEDAAGASLLPHRPESGAPRPPPHAPWPPERCGQSFWNQTPVVAFEHATSDGISSTFSFCSLRSTIWVSPDLSEHSLTISLCSDNQWWNSWTRSWGGTDRRRRRSLLIPINDPG